MLNSIWLNGAPLNSAGLTSAVELASAFYAGASGDSSVLNVAANLAGTANAGATADLDITTHLEGEAGVSARGYDASLSVLRLLGGSASATAGSDAHLPGTIPLAANAFVGATAVLGDLIVGLEGSATVTAAGATSALTRIRGFWNETPCTASGNTTAMTRIRGLGASSNATARGVGVMDVDRSGITFVTLAAEAECLANGGFFFVDVAKNMGGEANAVATGESPLTHIKGMVATAECIATAEGDLTKQIPMGGEAPCSASSDAAIRRDVFASGEAPATASIFLPRLTAVRMLDTGDKGPTATSDSTLAADVALAGEATASAEPYPVVLYADKLMAATVYAIAYSDTLLYANVLERATPCRNFLVPREPRSVIAVKQGRKINVHC